HGGGEVVGPAPSPARVADVGEHGLLEVEDEAAIPAGVRVRDLVRLAGIAEEQEIVREELGLVPAAEGEATRADDRQRWPGELLDARPFALLALTAVLEAADAAHRAVVKSALISPKARVSSARGSDRPSRRKSAASRRTRANAAAASAAPALRRRAPSSRSCAAAGSPATAMTFSGPPSMAPAMARISAGADRPGAKSPSQPASR